MIEKPYPISWLQASAITITSTIGVAIITLSRVIYAEAGPDSMISMVITAIFLLFTGIIFTKLCLLYPGKSISTIIEILTGRYLGFIIKLFYTAYLILLPTMTIRIFSEIVSEILLNTTPKIVVIGIMILASGYLVFHDIQVLGRFSLFVAPIIVFIPVTLLLMSLPGNFQPLYLLPLMTHTLQEIAKGALTSSFAFSGYEFTVFLLVYMQSPKEGYKTLGVSLVIIFIVYFFVVLSGIGIFGEVLVELQWPTLEAIRISNLPLDILQRVDGPFITIWILAAYTTVAGFYMLGLNFASELLKIDRKKLILPIGLLMLWITFLPRSIFDAFKLADYFGFMGVLASTIIPVGLYLISLIRRIKING